MSQPPTHEHIHQEKKEGRLSNCHITEDEEKETRGKKRHTLKNAPYLSLGNGRYLVLLYCVFDCMRYLIQKPPRNSATQLTLEVRVSVGQREREREREVSYIFEF